MPATLSVSKGVFVFKNGFKPPAKRTKKKRKQSEHELVLSDSLWYTAYRSLWNNIEEQIQHLNNEMFSNVLKNLVSYIKTSYQEPVLEIPTAALLTGINMPDHHIQFKTLLEELVRDVTPHVANLKAENCQNMKTLVENLVNQLLKTEHEESSEDDEIDVGGKVKKSLCNFRTLLEWYKSLSPKKGRKVIVVIIPEFENFCERVLQDFIQIVNSYLNVLPFVFVFGISTSVSAIHRTLPYQVSSKINVQVFQLPASVTYLNNVLENIFLTENCPFQLGDNVFNLFTDIFLFYDFSVSGFVQNIKYSMLQHFAYGNAMALCNNKHKIKTLIDDFTHDDLENVRRLMSFRKLVENERMPEHRIGLLSDDGYFKDVLRKEIRKLQKHMKTFHLFMRCLHVLVSDLPKAPLGKQLREIYSFSVSNITAASEYKECFQLLAFQSKDELRKKLAGILQILTSSQHVENLEVSLVIEQLQKYVVKMDKASLSDDDDDEGVAESIEQDNLTTLTDRAKLKEKLLQMSKQNKKPLNKYEKLRQTILHNLLEVFEGFLMDPTRFYFHEVFFFNDISIRDQLVGSHRASIHAALTDPQSYLQCSCCKINDDSIILPTMPDLSIAYKLHLECGKMINMYDWLQAFLTVIDPQNSERGDASKRLVKPELQARFTQAVAELEFLGFVKSSKRKTDHVARLTWGG